MTSKPMIISIDPDESADTIWIDEKSIKNDLEKLNGKLYYDGMELDGRYYRKKEISLEEYSALKKVHDMKVAYAKIMLKAIENAISYKELSYSLSRMLGCDNC